MKIDKYSLRVTLEDIVDDFNDYYHLKELMTTEAFNKRMKKKAILKAKVTVLEDLGIVSPEPDIYNAPCAFAFTLRLHIQDEIANEILKRYENER